MFSKDTFTLPGVATVIEIKMEKSDSRTQKIKSFSLPPPPRFFEDLPPPYTRSLRLREELTCQSREDYEAALPTAPITTEERRRHEFESGNFRLENHKWIMDPRWTRPDADGILEEIAAILGRPDLTQATVNDLAERGEWLSSDPVKLQAIMAVLRKKCNLAPVD